MTLIQMEYFIATARELNFTKAAKKLAITQQSLSASIAALEGELECALFARKVPLELTYAGREFLKHANDILSRMEILRQDFCDISTNQKGLLRIGVAPTRGRRMMPGIIGTFQRQYPGIQVMIKEYTNDAMYQEILSGNIDIAIGTFGENRRGISLRDFCEEEILLFASDELLERCFGADKAYVISELEEGNFAYLNQCPFVLGNPKDITGKIGMDFLTEEGIQPVIPVSADNLEILLSLCVKGIGLCFCPMVLVTSVLSDKELQTLHKFHLGPIGKSQIQFGYRKEERIWSVMQSFMESAIESVRHY